MLPLVTGCVSVAAFGLSVFNFFHALRADSRQAQRNYRADLRDLLEPIEAACLSAHSALIRGGEMPFPVPSCIHEARSKLHKLTALLDPKLTPSVQAVIDKILVTEEAWDDMASEVLRLGKEKVRAQTKGASDDKHSEVVRLGEEKDWVATKGAVDDKHSEVVRLGEAAARAKSRKFNASETRLKESCPPVVSAIESVRAETIAIDNGWLARRRFKKAVSK